MAVANFYGMIIFIFIIWLIGTFYWTRVLFAVFLLLVWGFVTVAFPIYLFAKYANNDQFIAAFLLVAACTIPAYLFLYTAGVAIRWWHKELEMKTFWKPWNAR